MNIFSKLLFSFDRSGFLRHAEHFAPETWSGKGKVALITGGNSGIGFAAAQLLLNYDVEVHLICRSEKRGSKALHQLKNQYQKGTVVLHILDISDQVTIDLWVKQSAPPKIDILINNAGGMSSTLKFNQMGDELTLATHLFGHYSLVLGLIKQKKMAYGSRVITVTSGGMYLKKLNLNDLAWKKQIYNKYTAYANAKRAQVILNEMFHEQFGDTICFSCMHPGWCDTKGVKNGMPIFYRCLKKILRTAQQGADTIVWLALTEIKYPGGKLWFDRKEMPPHKFSWTRESEKDRHHLWELLQKVNQ